MTDNETAYTLSAEGIADLCHLVMHEPRMFARWMDCMVNGSEWLPIAELVWWRLHEHDAPA